MALIAVAAVSTPSPGQQVTYHGSLQMSTGDYFFTERTRSVYLSNGLTAELGRFSLSASIPLVLQNSPWISYSAAGTIPTGGPDQAAVNRGHGDGAGQGPGGTHQKASEPREINPAQTDDPITPVDTVSYSQLGIGDPAVRLDVAVIRPASGLFSLRVGAYFKPPLAKVDRGFGTGSWDGGVGISTSTRLGRLFVFVSNEYWWFGDMPDLPLKNAWSYGLAVGMSIVPARLSMLVSYSGFTAIIDGVEPPRQAGFGLSVTPGGKYSVSITSAAGVSEGAPDFSVGLGWSLQI